MSKLLLDEDAINYTQVVNCESDELAEKLFNHLENDGEVLFSRQNKKRGHKIVAVKCDDTCAIVQSLRTGTSEDGDIYKVSVCTLESEHDAREIARVFYKNCYHVQKMVVDYMRKQPKQEVLEVEN